MVPGTLPFLPKEALGCVKCTEVPVSCSGKSRAGNAAQVCIGGCLEAAQQSKD